jgi:DNA topoisomerase-1
MKESKYETTSVKILANGELFTASGSRLVFQGFQAVYNNEETKENNSKISSKITKESELEFISCEDKQHFTQPQPHYTEASLVKELEELGIGRPSTYAPIITTLIGRRYIVKENKNLYITELGEIVNNVMKQGFPSIVDVTFTANLESLLDQIEEGNISWKTVVRNFYPDLEEAIEIGKKELEKITIEDEVSDVTCEICGRQMVYKYGPHGKFLACPGFPECKNTKPYFEKIGVSCPKCGGEVIIRKTKKGRKFYGCENNSECDFMSWQRPVNEKCPVCGGYMIERGSKITCADPSCGYTQAKEKKKDL